MCVHAQRLNKFEFDGCIYPILINRWREPSDSTQMYEWDKGPQRTLFDGTNSSASYRYRDKSMLTIEVFNGKLLQFSLVDQPIAVKTLRRKSSIVYRYLNSVKKMLGSIGKMYHSNSNVRCWKSNGKNENRNTKIDVKKHFIQVTSALIWCVQYAYLPFNSMRRIWFLFLFKGIQFV